MALISRMREVNASQAVDDRERCLWETLEREQLAADLEAGWTRAPGPEENPGTADLRKRLDPTRNAPRNLILPARF